MSRARFRGNGGLGPPGINFEAFRKSPGPDLDMMGHWGLQGSILIHLEVSKGRIWRYGTWDFEAKAVFKARFGGDQRLGVSETIAKLQR